MNGLTIYKVKKTNRKKGSVNRNYALGFAIIFSLISYKSSLAQHSLFLADGRVFSDTTFLMEDQIQSVLIASTSSDSVFLPIECKVIEVTGAGSYGGVVLEDKNKRYIYLFNFRKMFVAPGQILPKGKPVGQVYFDSCFGVNFLKIHIKNSLKSEDDITIKELLEYLRSLK